LNDRFGFFYSFSYCISTAHVFFNILSMRGINLFLRE
jgi:hypothetical protein